MDWYLKHTEQWRQEAEDLQRLVCLAAEYGKSTKHNEENAQRETLWSKLHIPLSEISCFDGHQMPVAETGLVCSVTVIGETL